MSEWLGNSRREQGTCPSGPSATRTVHAVAVGTKVLLKKVGDERWRPFVTRQENEFDRPYRETEKSFIYQQGGWLLCVSKKLVQVKTVDASVRRRDTILCK